ncbi:MAG: SBBP repeat-containing protein [Candidatus Thorarchaeota archaeon]|jgi:hypothetical protein
MKKSVRARKHLSMMAFQLSIGVLLLVFVTVAPLMGRGDIYRYSLDNLDDRSSIDIALDYLEDAGEFYENQGQFNDSNVRFYAKISGGYIGFGPERVTLWSGYSPPLNILVFDGVSHNEPLGLEKTEQITNYFLGSRGTFTNIRSYLAVHYDDVLPGIDITFDNPSKGVFCDVSIEDGLDSRGILDMFKVTYESEWIQVEKSIAAENKVRFNLLDRGCERFTLSQNDNILLSGYLGGADRDEAHSITSDVDGNLYITGKTYSSNFPVFNAYDSTYNGGEDVFVTKMDGNGIIEYSTYIGGSVATMTSAQPHEIGNDIAVDADGNVYVVGNTKSDDFPTVNPMYSFPENESILRSGYNDAEGDVFVLKLNSTGSIEYSTYFGGTNGETGTSISLDVDGNIYFAGRTSSEDLPLAYAIDAVNGAGNYEGFISCLSAAGDQLLFSTYFGGSQNDRVNDIAIDNSGSLVVTGNTMGGLSLTNPIYSSYGGVRDAFVLKIDSGWNVVYSTYLGGSERDLGLSVCVDSSGTAYITGSTNSSDFPLLSPLYDTKNGEFEDCFITAILEDGSDLLFSSFIGGYGTDIGESIDIDTGRNVTIAGTTWSQDFRRTSDQTIIQPNGFIFRTNLTHVLSSTFFGGADNDQVFSVVVGSQNNIAVCGLTRSDDIPFNGTLTYAGGWDAFVYSIQSRDNPIIPTAPPGDSWILYFMRPEVMIPTSAFSVIAIGALFLTVKRIRRREYEVAMSTTAGPVAGLLWNHPTDHPDGGLDPQRPEPLWNHPTDHPDSTPTHPTPEPQWNHPTDHPDGVLDPGKPVPQWNHPTDHPDGVLDPGTPEPQWNHPTDHPDGGLDPGTPEPQWNHPTDHPDGGLDPGTPEPQWNHPTDHPDGVLDPGTPEPQWNHPTDHPDGAPGPSTPEPQWNHPTDHPDGVLDPDKPVPQWNHPTDHPDGALTLEPKDMLLELPASHPSGCVCPLCSPSEYLEPTPKDVVDKSIKKSKKRSSDVELD